MTRFSPAPRFSRTGFLRLWNRLITLLFLCTGPLAQAQPLSVATTDPAPSLWHGQQRAVRYRPDGRSFVIKNGRLRFNRALYGTHTGFRVESGDLPEFALYMPGLGGTLRLGLIRGESSKWLPEAGSVTARYIPGKMVYEIQDPFLQNGTLFLTVIPTAEGEGMLLKAEGRNLPVGVHLFAAFGGASGTKFSRDGDIGADPESSFYLKPENCRTNEFVIDGNRFTLYYGPKKPLAETVRHEIRQSVKTGTASPEGAALKRLTGLFPVGADLKLGDARRQESPLAFHGSQPDETPALTARFSLVAEKPSYLLIQNPAAKGATASTNLMALFEAAESARQTLAGRIVVDTPDPWINTLGGALGVAADAIWEDPTFLHGAVAWRMRLNAWRGAYAADPLGWHDRARRHFSAYARSQVTEPLSGPVVGDTALHLARQLEKMGTALFSSGYICRNPNGDFRPHHYDMNLVFIDQLLNHFQYTGDTAYVREMWPVIQRHLDWEKRNFDADGDGLYDAYCCIWASDALQYSGGGVTHSTAYNYRAFKTAAELATRIGVDGEPYRREAARILTALNRELWMPDRGWYAEYRDLLASRNLHPSAGLWTIYHALDARVADPFQAYQALRYVDTHLPRIPLRVTGLPDTTLYLLSTTNWQPYTWSLNNVALAEQLHTALAYWQGGRSGQAYHLWKSALLESMYLSSAPGNFEQLSYYDVIRGELYRDFADPVGMAARTLVEGLFGVLPDALHDTLHIRPGFPADWDRASLTTPDLHLAYRRTSKMETFTLRYNKPLRVQFRVPARLEGVESVLVNGRKVAWKAASDAVGTPLLQFSAAPAAAYQVRITWKGKSLQQPVVLPSYASGQTLSLPVNHASIRKVYDPQGALYSVRTGNTGLNALVSASEGTKTVFVNLSQGAFSWWQPLNFSAVKATTLSAQENAGGMAVTVRNNTAAPVSGTLVATGSGKTFRYPLTVPARKQADPVRVPADYLVAGSNRIRFEPAAGPATEERLLNWERQNPASTRYEPVELSGYFNDQVTRIFRNQYLSPRPTTPTLQLPTQGIGNWCYPLTMADIDDSGLRRRAGRQNQVEAAGIPLATPGAAEARNILFTSLWDNYPDSARVPLQGRAAHAYLLLAGSTNPMQSRLVNGLLTVYYQDGTSERLELRNPENWWPIEQDYYTDGFAFATGAPKPIRVYLKSGEHSRTFDRFSTIKGFSNQAVEGGAATLLDLPLNPDKTLSHLVLKTVANDVVIGLMSVTLVRNF